MTPETPEQARVIALRGKLATEVARSRLDPRCVLQALAELTAESLLALGPNDFPENFQGYQISLTEACTDRLAERQAPAGLSLVESDDSGGKDPPAEEPRQTWH